VGTLLYRLIIFFVTLFPISAQSEALPFNLYENRIEFDVIRDGEKVGQHTTRFKVRGDSQIIESQMNMQLTVFSIPIYTFTYEATEIWSNNLMTNLDVLVLDGSEKRKITAFSTTNGFSIQGPSGDVVVAGPIMSTNHWNVNVVKEHQVINTLTGVVNQVQIIHKGRERISSKNVDFQATRYDYTGDLNNTSVWYDDNGRWVKLQFIARDGSTISYVCKSCDFKQ
jgi:hypothetical protein